MLVEGLPINISHIPHKFLFDSMLRVPVFKMHSTMVPPKKRLASKSAEAFRYALHVEEEVARRNVEEDVLQNFVREVAPSGQRLLTSQGVCCRHAGRGGGVEGVGSGVGRIASRFAGVLLLGAFRDVWVEVVNRRPGSG